MCSFVVLFGTLECVSPEQVKDEECVQVYPGCDLRLRNTPLKDEAVCIYQFATSNSDLPAQK